MTAAMSESPGHGKAARTRFKQDRGDQDWVPETVGRVRLGKRLEQGTRWKEWWPVLRIDSGDGGVFEMCLGCGNRSGQQGRKEAEWGWGARGQGAERWRQDCGYARSRQGLWACQAFTSQGPAGRHHFGYHRGDGGCEVSPVIS